VEVETMEMVRKPSQRKFERRVVVDLDERQQRRIAPFLLKATELQIGLNESDAGSVLMEVLGLLTPAQSISELATLKVLVAEIDKYAANPEAYDLLSRHTVYSVPALEEQPRLFLEQLPTVVLQALDDTLEVPGDLEGWWEHAFRIDGLGISGELDLSWHDVRRWMRERYERTGRWHGTYLDLRLALWAEARAYLTLEYAIEEPLGMEDSDYRESIWRLFRGTAEAQQTAQETPEALEA
jgi:hypothetical protein